MRLLLVLFLVVVATASVVSADSLDEVTLPTEESVTVNRGAADTDVAKSGEGSESACSRLLGLLKALVSDFRLIDLFVDTEQSSEADEPQLDSGPNGTRSEEKLDGGWDDPVN